MKRIDWFNILISVFLFLFCFTGYSKAISSGFDLSFELQTIYDDNVLNYSDADLDQMDDASAPEDKFGIESKNDFIINPELDITYKTIFAGHSIHLGLIADYYYYQKNDIKRHFRFEGYFRRYFKKGSYFEGSVVYLPDYYYRNSYISGVGYREAEFDKISLRAKIALRLMQKIQLNGYYTYSNKDFIPIFDERDINEHEIKSELIYHPAKLWKGWISYEYSQAKGSGADNPDYIRDTSYDSNLLTLGNRFYLMGLGGREFQIAGRASYKKVYYQTTRITSEDRYRLGREDDRWYIYLMLEHDITSAIDVGLTYKRYIKNVDLPAEDLKENLESSSNLLYFIIQYSL